MTHADLAQFRAYVGCDAVLQAQLLTITDRGEFITTVIETGRVLGFAFTADEVEAAMRANQRGWAERWIL